MSTSILRVAARGPSTSFFRSNVSIRPRPLTARAGLFVPSLLATGGSSSFGTTAPRKAEHQEETFEEFTAR
jgi:cytochrome c oxidase subunit 5a